MMPMEEKKSEKEGPGGKRLLTWGMIGLGVMNILYFFFGLSLGWGVYFGMLVMLLLGVFLIVYAVIRSTLVNGAASRWTRGVFRAIDALLILLLVSFLGVQIVIVHSAYKVRQEKSEYVLVLGAGLAENRPSLELRKRLDQCILYVTRNPGVKKVIVSGGRGKDEITSEAQVMYQYLVDHGISAQMILREDTSTNTRENIRYAKKLLQVFDSRKQLPLAIVTNDFHVFRAKLIAWREGFDAYGVAAPTPLYIIPNHFVREYFAVMKEVVAGICRPEANTIG